jgi:hypothetical protein
MTSALLCGNEQAAGLTVEGNPCTNIQGHDGPHCHASGQYGTQWPSSIPCASCCEDGVLIPQQYRCLVFDKGHYYCSRRSGHEGAHVACSHSSREHYLNYWGGIPPLPSMVLKEPVAVYVRRPTPSEFYTGEGEL